MALTKLTQQNTFEAYANEIMELRYSHTVQGRKESWEEIAARVYNEILDPTTKNIPSDIADAVFEIIRDRKFIPGGRILSQAGRPYHQTDNCFCLQADDTREGWAELAYKATMMFMSGGGVGVDYSLLRPYGSSLHRSGGISSGPIPLIQMINSIGQAARQGGERRGAIYASLKWDHEDVQQFIKMKQQDKLEHTNISVRFDKNWLDQSWSTRKAEQIESDETFMLTLKSACQYGDPGFQFDNDDQILRNACTEIISADDCDSCCLGSINLAKIDNLRELSDVTNLAVLFLLCNTLYTDIPYNKVAEVKVKNRRIGLGLMGVAEWFIQRGMQYGSRESYGEPTSNKFVFQESNITAWLQTWQQTCDNAALHWSNKLNIAKPIATRAIAPTGTISIAGGHTTPGIEPVFHTAYQRTYNTLKSKEYCNGYATRTVVDPVIAKWLQEGYNVQDIDTAWSLSQSVEGIERRLNFQAFVQEYVDNAISTTINLPKYQEGIEDKIAPVLLKYLPQLRGVTFYPDGRYENQPVVPIDLNKALDIGNFEQYEGCKGGDSCGV